MPPWHSFFCHIEDTKVSRSLLEETIEITFSSSIVLDRDHVNKQCRKLSVGFQLILIYNWDNNLIRNIFPTSLRLFCLFENYNLVRLMILWCLFILVPQKSPFCTLNRDLLVFGVSNSRTLPYFFFTVVFCPCLDRSHHSISFGRHVGVG